VPAGAAAAVEPMTVETTDDQTKTEENTSEAKLSVNNPCVLCGKEEKRLACIPCGHLVACVTCSQTLRTCPICRRGIEAFVRIYI
jgi:baculoviral IAP repeat-containing protein 7/8